MQMTNKEYSEYVKTKSPNSTLGKNLVWAFAVGGLISVGGQALNNMFKGFGMDKTMAGAATSVVLIFLGALFTGLGLYDKLAKFAGAGTIVPITGFANAIVSPAIEFKSEGYIMGMSGKMFSIAGPVLVFGISASIVLGVILMVFNVK